ncbi:MAG: glycosyltransferase family 2 protein [Muribaculaceae bacterium]|nr:glycosyltransferase family 2 protein [Bacteroidales bacterium]MDE6243622.1 glycosyltransferase family 2 protein [Muribaculaceae bacterium]
MKKKKVTLLSPAYNEEQALPLFYDTVAALADNLSDRYEWELLFVNDGSTDGTLRVLQELAARDRRVRYVDLSRNYGKETAMLAGFDNASGDCVITIDADLQEPPSTIPLMLEKWEQGYQDVYGRRRKRQQSFMKKSMSRAYHKLLSGMASGPQLSEEAGDFRLLDRKCIDALCRMRETQRYTKGMYDTIGFSKAPVDYDIAPRVAGTTKWTIGKLMHLAADGIMSHSVVPLRLASYMGLIVSAIAFIYLAVVLLKAIIWGDAVAGYPTIVSLILFLGGFILLALGIIGEYLGRIFLETKQRPPYFVNTITPVNEQTQTAD